LKKRESLVEASSISWPSASSRRGRILIQRADSIGVSVKLTSSETMMAKAMVNPKLVMKRPTMPPMNPTGTKIATRDKVVASTARPISRVASMAACIGGRPFSSTKR
jgi:hypothetical protein